jgi:hypothetical protein
MVAEAEPLVVYVLSSTNIAGSVLAGDRLADFIRFVEQELSSHGAIQIT